MRFLLTLLLLAPLAVAQAPPDKTPSRPAPPEANPPPKPAPLLAPAAKGGKVTIPLELSPAAAVKPLSTYYLEAGYGERQPGEKLSGFLKCFMEQDNFFAKGHQEKIHNWLALPLAELPDDVRKQAGIHDGVAYSPKYASMMVFADQAARYTRTEWNEYFNLRHDGIYTLLPEVQKLRALGYAVHLRMRGEVKAGEFDKAVASARTLFGLARLLETHPTMIGNLVGIAVALNAVAALEEMVARPQCPNLYWAFADLPTPFFSLREGISGERLFVSIQFAKSVPTDRAMTEKELGAVIRTVTEIQGMSGEGPVNLLDKPSVKYAALATDNTRLDGIRDRLTKAGSPADVVKAMPKQQLVLLEDVHRFEVTRDEIFKWMNRPHAEALTKLVDEETAIKGEKTSGWVLGPLFLPAAWKVKQAQAKLDQRLAYLMAVEAVRLYAHQNGGKLPEKLADLKVPEPLDPVSGKSFTYSVKDGVATLTGKNPTGLEADNRVYELKVRK
jgi:hypothetical protein